MEDDPQVKALVDAQTPVNGMAGQNKFLENDLPCDLEAAKHAAPESENDIYAPT